MAELLGKVPLPVAPPNAGESYEEWAERVNYRKYLEDYLAFSTANEKNCCKPISDSNMEIIWEWLILILQELRIIRRVFLFLALLLFLLGGTVLWSISL